MIETICNSFPRGPFRAAIFDFDGTLSLLRRNWQDVMIPMMVEILSAVDAAASRDGGDATSFQEKQPRQGGTAQAVSLLSLSDGASYTFCQCDAVSLPEHPAADAGMW